MDILDDMGVSKLSAKVFFKVNYSFKCLVHFVKQKLFAKISSTDIPSPPLLFRWDAFAISDSRCCE